MMNYLIFTDLDGTLLDHHNYTFENASDLIKRLKAHKIPIIFNTSKTYEETKVLQKTMQIDDPVIVENGGAIYIDGSPHILGKSSSDLMDFIRAQTYINLSVLSQMSIEEIVKRTGLNSKSAKMAKKRDYSQPFLFDSGDLERFKADAKNAGLDVIKGGRFYHLIDGTQSKGRALTKLKNIYEKTHNKQYKTVAIGDSANDLTMLEVADFAALVKKPDGTYEPFEREDLFRSNYAADRGWSDAIKRIVFER